MVLLHPSKRPWYAKWVLYCIICGLHPFQVEDCALFRISRIGTVAVVRLYPLSRHEIQAEL